MIKPERGSVLKRTTETEEKPCLHKKGGILGFILSFMEIEG
jgi:hypothetical protein